MLLTNKYLKYTPEITLEIFTLVWKSFEKAKYGLGAGLNTIFNNWKKWNHIILDSNSICTTNNPSLINNLSETTIQEILGYDPFVKEKVIPEYVEYIKSDDVGKIAKVLKWSAAPYCRVEFPNGTIKEPFKHLVKPSTKEAFDAQNKPKQPLKQAVHCKTQEEWDFVTEKLNYKWIESNWYGEDCCINALEKETANKGWWLSRGYQILSFQEWCDLNGYKMKKETMFEPGKWYSFYWTWYNSGLVIIKVLSENDNSVKVSYYYRRGSFYDNSECDCAFVLSEIKDIKELSIEEIQQYLPDNHPDKIESNQEFKVGDWVLMESAGTGNGLPFNLESVFVQLLKIDEDKQPTGHLKDQSDFMVCYNKKYYRTKKYCIIRHATPEEINNHLISIGQIPNKEKYEYQGEYKPSNSHLINYEIKIHEEFFGNSKTQSLPKILLSIDDEELPMVNIIKTNTVKQLLNND